MRNNLTKVFLFLWVCIVPLLILSVTVYSNIQPPSLTARSITLRNLTTERAYVYMDGVEIASNLTGSINQVTVPDHPDGNITVLHNHPYQPGLWEGFSFEDLRSARQFNVTQMVLVTQSGIWSTKVPFKDWYFSPF